MSFSGLLLTLGLTGIFLMLFSYLFALAWDEERAWWKRCQEKLAVMQRLSLHRQ